MTTMGKIPENSRIYILGAGFAGRAIARDIRKKSALGSIVAFLDDDPAKVEFETNRAKAYVAKEMNDREYSHTIKVITQ